MKFFKKFHLHNDEGNVCYIWGILFLLSLVGLYGIVYSVDHILPTPLTIEDEEDYPDSFIAERAKNYLKPLTDIGPRPTGSDANEYCAVKYIVDTIRNIKAEANLVQKIEWSLQSATGSFLLEDGTIHTYANVQNIIVKISSCNDTPGGILLNTHFDTAPHSPGANDDGINVAVALEVFRKVSQLDYRPQNSIVFLFNGAKEVGRGGAHGFITQHKWSEDVTLFINLDAAGAGGREILFEVGPDRPWLFKYYNVPHPHCNVAAEELFQSETVGLVTDFRVINEASGIAGYNMAFIRDGYRYHTKYDRFESIDEGRFQHTGDNVLHLVRNLAAAREVSEPTDEQGLVVYFDFLGLFYILYDANWTAFILNIVATLLSIVVMIWTSEKYKIDLMSSLLFLPVTAFVKLLGIFINLAIVLMIGCILDIANSTMSWYRAPGMIFCLYIAPTVLLQLLTTMFIQHFLRHKDLAVTKKVLLQIHANRFLWTLVLLVGSFTDLRSMYIITIPVLFNTAGMAVIQCFRLHKWNSLWFCVYILFSILPTVHLMYFSHELLAFYIPLMSRFDPNINPEFIIGSIIVLVTTKIVSYFVPFMLFIRKQWHLLFLLVVVFLAGFILALTPSGFPYQANESHPALQRYSIYHAQRTFKNDSGDTVKSVAGFYFYKNDRNAPNTIANDVASLTRAASVSEDCKMGISCGLPRSYLGRLDDFVWIPADFPVFSSEINFACLQRNPNTTQSRFDCTITGSDRIDAYLSIRPGSKLTSINLVDEIPTEAFTWKGQPTYYISFVGGSKADQLHFTIVLEKGENHTGPVVDLAFSAKYIHEESFQKTDQYEAFLEEFPDWVMFECQGLAHYQTVTL